MTLLPTLPYLYLSNKASIQVYERFRQRTVNDYISPQIIFRVDYHHEDEVNCPICLEIPILPRMDKCGHIFCLNCLIKLCKHENTAQYILCPLCKSCNISAEKSKRVTLKKKQQLQVGQEITLKLLARGKNSKFPDYYENLVAPYPFAPNQSSPNAVVTNVSVVTDQEVVAVIRRDMILCKNQKDQLENEIVKFLSNELAEFRLNIELDQRNKQVTFTQPEDCLDCFNFTMDIDKQLERFDLSYQSSDYPHVLLDPRSTIQLITQHKKSERGLLADITGRIKTMQVIKMTPSYQQESNLLNLPPGTLVTFVTLDIIKVRFTHPPFYDKAIKVKQIIEKNAAQFAKERQESQRRQTKLKTQGITFTPIVQSSSYVPNAISSRPNNDSPSSYNLCMFGLECDDPDDDYPHDVMCYRYHDANRRREFEENSVIEDDPFI